MAGLAQEPADPAPTQNRSRALPVGGDDVARGGSVKNNDPSLRHAHGAITQG